MNGFGEQKMTEGGGGGMRVNANCALRCSMDLSSKHIPIFLYCACRTLHCASRCGWCRNYQCSIVFLGSVTHCVAHSVWRCAQRMALRAEHIASRVALRITGWCF
jgi:hypothetical protein